MSIYNGAPLQYVKSLGDTPPKQSMDSPKSTASSTSSISPIRPFNLSELIKRDTDDKSFVTIRKKNDDFGRFFDVDLDSSSSEKNCDLVETIDQQCIETAHQNEKIDQDVSNAKVSSSGCCVIS